jgi:hypothetical protein
MLNMDFDRWIKVGYDNGWCGPAVCYTHDGLPTTADEDEELAELDPCVHIIRLYEDATVKAAVEENHSPSQWRASNSGLTRSDAQ